jgi:hypothetical protein
MKPLRPLTPSAIPTALRPLPWRAGAAVALVLAATAGCGSGGGDCTADAPPPSFVRIVDRDGAIVPDAKLLRKSPGFTDSEVGCKRPEVPGACERLSVELPPGSSTLVASRADGTSRVEKIVSIANEGTADCPRPVSQQITIVLDP